MTLFSGKGIVSPFSCQVPVFRIVSLNFQREVIKL